MEILLWKEREKQKVRLTALTRRLEYKISRTTLNNIENGRVSPTMQQMEDLAIALGVRITDLFDSPVK